MHKLGGMMRHISNDGTTITEPSMANVLNPFKDETIEIPNEEEEEEDGIASVSNTPDLIGRTYKLYHMGANPILSNEAENVKAVIVNRYYRDNPSVPSDFVFENFAKNGIADRVDIQDMWVSVYPEVKKVLESIDEHPAINRLLRLTDEEGKAKEDATVATYHYVDALAALMAKSLGIRSSDMYSYNVGVPKSQIHKAKTGIVPKVTSSGLGGLPAWDDVSQHMGMVFHDPTLESAVTQFFTNPSKTLSRNHQRMLRAMHRTYPIGIGYTFDQWLQALKLIYQTKTLVGGTQYSPDRFARSPYFKYPSNTPRLARYRN